MSIFTCNNCYYTFSSPAAVTSCPDCGKTIATRIWSNGSFHTSSPVPAIRPATEAEQLWYARVQAELAETDRSELPDTADRAARRAG